MTLVIVRIAEGELGSLGAPGELGFQRRQRIGRLAGLQIGDTAD